MDHLNGLSPLRPSSVSSLPAASPAAWEHAIRSGNEAARAGHAGVALRHTRHALAIAHSLHENRRTDGIAALCNVVHWAEVARHFQAARG